MKQSDILFKIGWIIYLLIPLLIMIISYALTDQFIPWAWSMLREYAYSVTDGVTSVCDYCDVAKYGLGLPLS